jgi:hypothetical protein
MHINRNKMKETRTKEHNGTWQWQMRDMENGVGRVGSRRGIGR